MIEKIRQILDSLRLFTKQPFWKKEIVYVVKLSIWEQVDFYQDILFPS